MLEIPGELRAISERAKAARRQATGGRRGRDWCRIENKTEEEAEVYIYDEVGYWGTTAAAFVQDLKGIKAKRIALHINSPGGDIFDGIAIYNALRQHAASVHVQVDSLAASIATVIAMAGDTVTMAQHATMMIHDGWGITIGDAEEHRKMAGLLDQLSDNIASVYAERAGGSTREWRDRMLAETWFTDRQAVEAGLADEVDGDDEEQTTEDEGGRRFDLSLFKNVPAELAAGADTAPDAGAPTKRDIERALRDAGLTRQQAKAFIAAAYHEAEQDDPARDVSELLALRDALKVLI